MSVTPCHALSRVTSRELSRIGHAMSTTPHHTTPTGLRLFVVDVVQFQIQKNASRGAALGLGAMA